MDSGGLPEWHGPVPSQSSGHLKQNTLGFCEERGPRARWPRGGMGRGGVGQSGAPWCLSSGGCPGLGGAGFWGWKQALCRLPGTMTGKGSGGLRWMWGGDGGGHLATRPPRGGSWGWGANANVQGESRVQPEPLSGRGAWRGREGGLSHARVVCTTSPESLRVRMRDPGLNPRLGAERKFQPGGRGDGGTLLPPSGAARVLSLLLPNTWAAGTICSGIFVHRLPAPTAKRSTAPTSQDDADTLLPADPLAPGTQPLEWDLRATPKTGGAQPPRTRDPSPQPAWLPGPSDGLSQGGVRQKFGGSFPVNTLVQGR